MAHHADVGGRVQALGGTVQQHIAEIGSRRGTTGRRAVGDTYPAAGQQQIILKPGRLQCQLCRPHGHQGNSPHGARRLTGVVHGLFKIYRATQFGEQSFVSLPFRHIANSVLALLQPDSSLFPILTQGGNTTHASNNYSLHLAKTAVNGDNLSGHITGGIAEQETYDCSHLFRLS